MSEEYINRQAAIERAVKDHNFYKGATIPTDKARRDELLNVICWLGELSAANVAPVVHGKWIGYDDTERFTAQCNLCGNVIDTRFGSNFCPNCGAKMDGGDEHG